MGKDLWRRVLLIVAVFAIVPAAALLREVFEDDPCSDTAAIVLALSCAPDEPEADATPISNVHSPARLDPGECRNRPGTMIRSQMLPVEHLDENLEGYVPGYIPDEAAFLQTWRGSRQSHSGELGSGAHWITEDCRWIEMWVYPTERKRSYDWVVNREEMSGTKQREELLIDLRTDIGGTQFAVITWGFPKTEAFRVARSIAL